MPNICNWLIIYSLWQNWVWTPQTVVESDEEIEAEEDDEKEDKKVPFPLLLEIHALKSTKRKGKYLKIENKHNRFGHNIMEWNFNELHVQFKTFFEKGHCHLLAGIILQKHFLQRDLLYWVYSWIFAPLCSISFLETVS